MKRKAVIRPAAQAEIDHQADYLAERAGEAVAAQFLAALADTIGSLLETPGLGSPWSSRHPRIRAIRKQKVVGFPNHILFYRYDDAVLEVLHLYHGAQDIDARFP